MGRKRIERNIYYDDERESYYVVFNFGKDPVTGKQIKPYKTFDKLKEARAALRQHEAARDMGQVVIPKELTLHQWLDTWMQDIVELKCADTTVYGYQQMIRNHIAPALGDIPLQKLTVQQVQNYYSEKIKAGKISSNTVRKHHDLLNRALKVAVKQGLILSNPAQNAEAPHTERPDIDYYSFKDLQKLLQLAEGTRLEAPIKLAGFLGLRREEIMGLTWNCVDFEAKKILIRKARTSAGSEIVVKEPKNKTSRRTLHMPPDIEELLLREREKQQFYKEKLGNTYTDSGYVVTFEDGRPIRPNYVSDLFKKFIKDNDLPSLTLHGLRHSFASIASAKGIPLYDIGRALGHSSPSTTGRIYTHLLDPDHKDMLEKLWEK